MTADENQDIDAAPAEKATESGEPEHLDAEETVEVVGEQLKPKSPIENLKSNVPMPGDSLLTKVMKIVTSWM